MVDDQNQRHLQDRFDQRKNGRFHILVAVVGLIGFAAMFVFSGNASLIVDIGGYLLTGGFGLAGGYGLKCRSA